MTFLTHEEIDCCRRIGRDEIYNRSTIGLPELDALCDTADLGARAAALNIFSENGAVTLVRHVKGDTDHYKYIIYQHTGYSFYVEVCWRRYDMAMPMIEPVFHDAKRSAAEARMMATLLNAAAAEADAWVKKAAAGVFWSGTLKER